MPSDTYRPTRVFPSSFPWNMLMPSLRFYPGRAQLHFQPKAFGFSIVIIHNNFLCPADQVDAVPVHLANGVWGVIAAGLFASEEGYSSAYYPERSQR